jgi:hypothetical protein
MYCYYTVLRSWNILYHFCTYSQAEVDDMIRKSTNLLLTRSFSGCLSSLFRKPSLALLQVIQIIIDTGYLEDATVYLEEFVSNITGYVIYEQIWTFYGSWSSMVSVDFLRSSLWSFSQCTDQIIVYKFNYYYTV